MRKRGVFTDKSGEEFIWIPRDLPRQWMVMGMWPRLVGLDIFVRVFRGEDLAPGLTLQELPDLALRKSDVRGSRNRKRFRLAIQELVDAGLLVETTEGVRIEHYYSEGEARPPVPRREVFERDGWLCTYCRCAITLETGHVDHVHPWSRGGSNEMSNLAAACRDCNIAKGAKTLAEWKPEGGVQ